MIGSTPQLVVLDTTVVSILFREQTELARQYEQILSGLRACISFQTVEEQMFGALKGEWGIRRINQLVSHLNRFEVIQSSPELTEVCSRLRVKQELKGRALQTADAWIAATALLLNCTLAYEDKDFGDIEGLYRMVPQTSF